MIARVAPASTTLRSVEVADSAADLHGAAEGLDDAADDLGVLRRPREGAVEVDDVQFAAALLGPVLRLPRRIVAIDRHVVGAPLLQAYALAVFKINRGNDYHMTPFEDGTPFSSGSIALARRNARAKLLKSPSHTWWASSP